MKFETKVLRKVAEYYYTRIKETNPNMTIRTAIMMAQDAMVVVSQATQATRDEVKDRNFK
jgi:hypothetical protein